MISSTLKISDKYSSDKIDNQGNFILHRGITCISMCVPDKRFQSIYNFIENSEIGKFYKPLPIDSYHMTSFAIPSDCDETYLDTIDNDIDNIFSDYFVPQSKLGLQNNNYNKLAYTKMKKTVKLKINNLFCTTVLGADLGFTNKEESIKFNHLRNKYKTRQEHDHHVSFAYKYGTKFPTSRAFFDDVKKLIKMLSKIKFMRVLKPEVRYFDSMKHFYTKSVYH